MLWTSNKEQAATLLAEDSLTIAQIAKKLHVTEKTIDRWKAEDEFKKRVEANVGLFRVRCLEFGLARKEARIAELSELHRLTKEFISERGASPAMQTIPGGKTGLVAMQWKMLGSGEEAQAMQEYEADTGLMREFRATLEQIARELGQWEEKQEIKVTGQLSIAEILRDRRHKREEREKQQAVNSQPSAVSPDSQPILPAG